MSEIVGFEHLHLHTDFSILDGYGRVEEYATRAPTINQKFLCISDHGIMGAVPRQIQACEEHGLEPIFGVELYVNEHQPEVEAGKSTSDYTKDMDEATKKKLSKSCHLLALAYNEIGYVNLVKMSSWAWLKGFYRRPRVNYDQLMKHKEGVIFSTACYNGEIGHAYESTGDEQAAFDVVERYKNMFGDNLYLEMMLLDFPKQKPYNELLIKAHERFGIPLIVTNDVHYCLEADSIMQRCMLMIQTGKTMADIDRILAQNQLADLFELQDMNLWMKSEEEINRKWREKYADSIDKDIFNIAKMNTVAIAEKAKGVQLDRSIKLPHIEDDNQKLKDLVLEGFQRRNLPSTSQYLNRIVEEYELIRKKGFSSYFLIQKMMVDEARRISPKILGYGDGSQAVGPGRGSCVGSLICYCLGITDVNPIEHDLLFSRFLSPARGGKQMRLRFTSQPLKAA
jgi:DNA polymerase-3 subunit alpha